MANANYKVFGLNNFDDAMLTADIEDADECDAFNDETFNSKDILPDVEEWEIEDLSEQTESAEQSIKSQGDVYADQFNDSNDLQEMVEKSLFKLMADDDFTNGQPIPRGINRQENDFKNIFGSNSPQNPFLQFRQNQNIWGTFNGGAQQPPQPHLVVEQQPTITAPNVVSTSNSDAMQELLAKLGVSPNAHQSNSSVSSLKNAKTVEEIEGELLLAAQKTPTKVSGDDQRPQMSPMQDILHMSRPANPLDSNKQNVLKMFPPNNLPPQPILPPNFHPSMMPQLMMNPQFRAAIMACLASGKPLPAGMLPPPPHFLRMPFMPNRPMGPMPSGNFGTEFKQNSNRPMPQHPQFGRAQFMNRHPDQRMPPNMHMRHNHHRDPYAGLMSRREREWLIKIQTLQLQVEDPYKDDYYWTMYQNKKILEAQKDNTQSSAASDNSTSQKNSDVDNLEHHRYVPPTFEGSLGKVQVSSVSCPRQVIDIGVAEPRSPSSSSSSTMNLLQSPSPQLFPKNLLLPRSSKKLTSLLMDIENGYELILECESLLLQTKSSSNQNRRSEQFKEIVEKIVVNSQKCLNLLCSGENKFTSVLNSHKGRRLIGKMFNFLKQDDLISAIQILFAALSNVTRKEILSEVYASIVRSVRGNFNDDLFSEERNWSTLLNVFNNANLSAVLKTQFGYALILTLIYYCAKERPNLTHESKSFINRFASFAASELCPLAGDVEMNWFGRQELSTIVFWMTNLVGVDAFVVNRCENQWRSLIK